MVRTKWLAALSDGTTAVEGIAPFEEIKDELSPWQKLLAHLVAIVLRITGMRIQITRPGEATFTFNLPSQQRTPKGNHEKWVTLWPLVPEKYSHQRWATFAPMSGQTHHHIEIRADFIIERPGRISVSLLADEDEGNEAWVVVHREKAESVVVRK